MKCPSCGNENPAETKFCGFCGAKLSPESSAQQSNTAYQNFKPEYPQPHNEPFFKQTWFIILSLIVFFPVGLVLMWSFKKEWKTTVKIIVTAGIVLLFIIGLAVGGGENDSDSDTDSSSIVTTSVQTTVEETSTTVESTTVTTVEETTTTTTTTTSIETTEATTSAENESGYSLQFGDLLSTIENNIDGKNVIVVKAKITSSLTNKMTIDQNYHNVEDLIKNQGCDKFDEIQYWAVADMADGSEGKVISFTVDSDLIQKIKSSAVVAIQMGDYVSDLYILPSLLN